MTGLDTNVLVRFFAQDDLGQCQRADRFLQTLTPENPGFVSIVVLVELVWVLRSRYSISKPILVECLGRLLNAPELEVESPAVVLHALARYAHFNADFSDCLIERAGALAGCDHTVTFDKNAAASVAMRLL